MKLKYLLIYCSVLLAPLFFTACTSVDTSLLTKFKDKSAQTIFDEGVRAMKHHNNEAAIEHFEALQALYPFSHETEQGELDLIYVYYQAGESAEAIAAANRYLKLYPASSALDYVYYLRGLTEMQENRTILEHFLPSDPAERDLEELKRAYADFMLLASTFPKSLYAYDARQRAIFIRNILALHELEVAEFYEKRGAYVAAINRANEIVLHYQGAPAVTPATKLLVRVYKKLKLDPEAQQLQSLLS